MLIGKVRTAPTTRVIVHEKSSLAPPGQSLAFSRGDEKGFSNIDPEAYTDVTKFWSDILESDLYIGLSESWTEMACAKKSRGCIYCIRENIEKAK